MPMPLEPHFTPEAFQDLVALMVQWSSCVIRTALDEHGEAAAAQVRTQFVESVTMMQSLAATFTPHATVWSDQAGGRIFGAAMLLQCLRFGRMLKNKGKLREACDKGVTVLFPRLLGTPLQRNWIETVPLPSAYTVRIARLHLDIALLLVSKELFSEPCVRYVTADSSPQLGRD